jgi:uncharacterized protein involved in outer membrane biogenesis
MSRPDPAEAVPKEAVGRARPRPLRVLAWLIAIGLVVVGIGVAIIATMDWNRARPWVSQRVSAMLQRPFVIDGDLRVEWLRVSEGDGERSWLAWPHVFAHDVAIGNPEWAKEKHWIKVDELAFAVSPLPLLVKTLDIPAMRLTGTVVNLERRADGSNTWTLARSGSAPSWNLVFGDLVLEQGRIVVDDAIQRVRLTIETTPLGAPLGFDDVLRREEQAERSQSAQTIGERAARQFSAAAEKRERGDEPDRSSGQAYEFEWTAKGTLRGAAIEGNGRSGGILDFRDADNPFPLQARFRSGKTRIAFIGTLTNPTALDALDLRLWLAGRSMADLFALTGVALPRTPPFATEGRLQVDFEKGASVFNYKDFTGRVGGSDLAGTLTYTEGDPRGKLTGALRSSLLQSVDLAELVGAHAGDDEVKRLFPDVPFSTERWNAMDADVSLSGDRVVHAKEWPIDKLETRIRLDRGHLRLEPLTFGIAGGRVDGAVRIDGADKPPSGQIEARAQGLEMQQLLPKLATAEASFGEINAAVALAGDGNSIASLMGSANGEVKLLVEHGQISKLLLETAGLNIGNLIRTRLFGDRSVELNCAVAQFVTAKGVMNAQAFLVDTDEALIEVGGHIDLGSESLELDVRPQAKRLRILSLRSPLFVRGSLLAPEVGVKKGPLIARGAGAILLAVFAAPAAALVPLIATSKRGDPGRCEALLAQMRVPTKAG